MCLPLSGGPPLCVPYHPTHPTHLSPVTLDVSTTEYCLFNKLFLKQQNKMILFGRGGTPANGSKELFWEAEMQCCGIN